MRRDIGSVVKVRYQLIVWTKAVFIIRFLMISISMATILQLEVAGSDNRPVIPNNSGREDALQSANYRTKLLEQLEHRLESEPKNVELLYSHSNVELDVGNYKSAESDLDKALSYAPDGIKLY
jgi:tetratricopeptide (TPR) repeat protein